MTEWTLHADRRTGTCLLMAPCGGCGRTVGVVMNEDAYVRLVRDPGMPLDNMAGAHALRTGRHKECDERTAA